MRYAAPLYGLLFLLLSAGVARFWKQNQRAIGIALLCPPLVIGLHARVKQVQPPFPDVSVFDMAAPDFDYARDQISYLLPLEEHRRSLSDDPMVSTLHDFGIAWHETRAILDQNASAIPPIPTRQTIAAWEGVAAALLPEIDPDSNGGVRTLVYLQERVAHFPVNAQIHIHAEVTSRRNWESDLPEHTNLRLQEWLVKLEHLPPIAKQGALLAFGTKWGEDVARWRRPQPVQLPPLAGLSTAERRAFVEGFAVAIGERWGPDSVSVQPAVPTRLSDAWVKGRNRGIEKRWLRQTH